MVAACYRVNEQMYSVISLLWPESATLREASAIVVAIGRQRSSRDVLWCFDTLFVGGEG
jgi:hypothetical protein